MWGEKPWSFPTGQWICEGVLLEYTASRIVATSLVIFFRIAGILCSPRKSPPPRELHLLGTNFKAFTALQHNRWQLAMQNCVSACDHRVNIIKAFSPMTVVVIWLPSSALLFPATLSAALEALKTHVTWRINLHVTALCILRGKSIIFPGSLWVYREETAERHFHTKSICFGLLFGCFWSTCKPVLQMSHLRQLKPLNSAKTRGKTQKSTDKWNGDVWKPRELMSAEEALGIRT